MYEKNKKLNSKYVKRDKLVKLEAIGFLKTQFFFLAMPKFYCLQISLTFLFENFDSLQSFVLFHGTFFNFHSIFCDFQKSYLK